MDYKTTYTVVEDHKKRIQFWLDALSQPNISRANIALLNQCLERELGGYLMPALVTVEDIAEAKSILEARR